MEETIQIQRRRVRAQCPALLLLCLLVLLLLWPAELWARPTSVEQARKVVAGWLKANPRPLGAVLGRQILEVDTFRDGGEQAVYYVVYLKSGGYVVVPADDAVEPILCFVERGTYEASDDKPLAALLGRDVPARIAAARASQAADDGTIQIQTSTGDKTALRKSISEAQDKWDRLSAAGSSVTIMGLPSVSDRRVGPLTQTTWGQTTIGNLVGGKSCYNYYTPPEEYGYGDPCNYPIGCVAAAMAQLMRYHEYPVGPYVWSDMPLQPTSGITPVQQQAIGWLCFQAAESIDTKYGSGGSTASLDDAYAELRDTFGYSNSVIARNPVIGTALNNMVNSNLDASLPVLMGFDGTSGSHAVICDGYGYNASTLYHHLNMGWSGYDNAWYALPEVDASSYYYAIHACVYNIFTSDSGEIISGRVTDMAGNPIPGVQIQAEPTGSSTRYTTTNTDGIYAVVNLPSNTSVTVTPSKPPHIFTGKTVSTGRSSDYSSSSGNKWGVDFVSSGASPPRAFAGQASALSGKTGRITLAAIDDGLPNPPGELTYIISRLPEHGRLTDPAGGRILGVPHALAGNGNAVDYWPCTYYAGSDSFEFVANDGGTPPSGGDSAPVPVTVDVNNVTYTTFAPHTHSVAPWPFGTSYDDSRTQVIYLSSEIGGPNTITGLALDVHQRPGYPNLNYWTIRMKHTSRSAYYSTPYFETGDWTIVYFSHEGRPTTGWYQFEFQTPFEYNGTSNLMIDFSHDNNGNSGPDSDGLCTATDTYERRVVLGFSDSWHGAPTSWDDDTFYPYYPYWATAVPNIRLKSQVSGTPIPGDFELNCSVNIIDLRILSDAWLANFGGQDWCDLCNISPSPDNIINEFDFAVFAENWHRSVE